VTIFDDITAPNEDDLNSLALEWLEAKEAEGRAVKARRDVEDLIKKIIKFQDASEATCSIVPSGAHYKIRIEGRIDRKVDGAKLQVVAEENGLTDHLGTLFRWKPEINMKIWKDTDEEITRPLAPAITAKPGRPSFTITRTDDENAA
jgi:hypothetical protein